MNYTEARAQIQSGDIVFFGKSKQLFSQIESWWCKSEFTHSAIAFRIPMGDSDRVFVVEEHSGGQRIVNLASYMSERKTIDIMVAPVDWERYGYDLISGSGSNSYAYPALIEIGLREKFGIRLPDVKGEVCSEMVARVMIANGIELPTSQVSPGLLRSQLLGLGCKSRLTITNIIA